MKNLVGKKKEVRPVECVDGDNVSFSAPERLCVQNPIPSQPPKIDSAKVQSLLLYLMCFLSNFGVSGN